MKEYDLELEKIVNRSDMILVGIGYEYRITNEKMEMNSKYNCYLQKIAEDEKKLGWLKAFLKAKYIIEYDGEILNAYLELYKLIGNKNYFIVSLNDDELLEKANFNSDHIVLPCGTHRLMQCINKCDGTLYKSSKIVQEVWGECESHFDELRHVEIPTCPTCGANLVFNNLQAQNYDEKGYLNKWENYTQWLQSSLNKKICILELGVGMEFPSIVRWPFEKIAFYNKQSRFVRIHHKLFQLSEEIKENGISIPENAVKFFANKIV